MKTQCQDEVVEKTIRYYNLNYELLYLFWLSIKVNEPYMESRKRKREALKHDAPDRIKHHNI